MVLISSSGRSNSSRETSGVRYLEILMALAVGFAAGSCLAVSSSCGDLQPSLSPLSSQLLLLVEDANNVPKPAIQATTTSIQTDHTAFQNDVEKDFYAIALKTGTDKASGPIKMQKCLKDPASCKEDRLAAVNPKCRIVGHFYHDVYQRWLGPFSKDSTEPFQFLEIGMGQGRSVPAFAEFLPRAERHMMDHACIEKRWATNPEHLRKKYQALRDAQRLHCGDSSNFEFLHKVYQELRRPGAPPLRVVVEDASHIEGHMSAALFFWFPRLEPGGLLIMEDIEPNSSKKHGGHRIQTDLLPQIINDVHYCGDAVKTENPACFPTIQPLLKSVHCDLHICVFERNEMPASDPSKEMSTPPSNALDGKQCLFK
jgi:hypothetical protein